MAFEDSAVRLQRSYRWWALQQDEAKPLKFVLITDILKVFFLIIRKRHPLQKH